MRTPRRSWRKRPGSAACVSVNIWIPLEMEKSRTAEELTEINDHKTGALLRAACMMGVAAAMGRRAVDDSCMTAARDYATYLGLAFQIRDDVLDVTATAEELGKPIGSDAANKKSTYVALLGRDECERRVLDYTERAKEALNTGEWKQKQSFYAQ